MKTAATGGRFLLGIIFTIFGLNGFLHFLPLPPPQSPIAAQFMGALFESHFMVAVYFIQLACGLLFVSGRFVPLTLLLIGPVIFNILLYHVTMDPAGIAPGLFAAICWAIIFYRERSAFAGVFRERS